MFWFYIFKESSTWVGFLLLLCALITWFFVLRISYKIFSEYRQNTTSQLPHSSNTYEFPCFCVFAVEFLLKSIIFFIFFVGLLPIDKLRYLPIIVGMVSYITFISPLIAFKLTLVLLFFKCQIFSLESLRCELWFYYFYCLVFKCFA